MKDFAELLNRNIDTIIQRWMETVRHDRRIEITQELSPQGLRDSLPRLLEAMTTTLSQAEDNDVQTLVSASLEHGVVRAEQGFEPSEIAQEYRLLRSTIFDVLEPDLLKGAPQEVLRAVRLIDAVIDEAIARCFSSYTQERLSELEQLQSQLKLTNQELTRLVRASQVNLSQLAHELKTPLTSIIGYSDLFLRQQRQNSQVQASTPNLESIERVLQGGRQLLRLINDTLEISRYEAGKMLVQPACTDVRAVVRSVVEMVQPLAIAKSLKIVVTTDRAPDQVTTDSLRLQQILTNLLSNAIRYTESGTIQVSSSAIDDQYWAIAVTDPGMGIEPEDQAKIFEPYFRTQQADADRDGTGLGLAIVARLVKLLQGSIAVTSQVGIGSTFTVQFPRDLPALDYAECSSVVGSG